jgi:hypothetical protein
VGGDRAQGGCFPHVPSTTGYKPLNDPNFAAFVSWRIVSPPLRRLLCPPPQHSLTSPNTTLPAPRHPCLVSTQACFFSFPGAQRLIQPPFFPPTLLTFSSSAISLVPGSHASHLLPIAPTLNPFLLEADLQELAAELKTLEL